jgi:hypothetical protein
LNCFLFSATKPTPTGVEELKPAVSTAEKPSVINKLTSFKDKPSKPTKRYGRQAQEASEAAATPAPVGRLFQCLKGYLTLAGGGYCTTNESRGEPFFQSSRGFIFDSCTRGCREAFSDKQAHLHHERQATQAQEKVRQKGTGGTRNEGAGGTFFSISRGLYLNQETPAPAAAEEAATALAEADVKVEKVVRIISD